MNNNLLFLRCALVPALVLAVLLAGSPVGTPVRAGEAPKKTPVIFDTDIGDDIDDTWALAMLLRSPELDVKLVVGDYGKPQYRARLLAKLLQAAGRTDIPIGIGMETANKGEGRQAEWVKGYDLAAYRGKVHKDGVQAMIDLIMGSPGPVTVIAVGPLPNVAAALEREPRIAQKARFVGMHGSVRVGYGGGKTPSAEYNVERDAAACRKVFTASWNVTITPLDTCGIVDLQGERYARVRQSRDPLAAAVIENYRIWSAAGRKEGQPDPFEAKSSILFDTVAVYLAFSEVLVKMEGLPIEVTEKGLTRIQPGAKEIRVATEWKDLNAFRDLLAERVAGRP